jgi:hypothetical protein
MAKGPRSPPPRREAATAARGWPRVGLPTERDFSASVCRGGTSASAGFRPVDRPAIPRMADANRQIPPAATARFASARSGFSPAHGNGAVGRPCPNAADGVRRKIRRGKLPRRPTRKATAPAAMKIPGKQRCSPCPCRPPPPRARRPPRTARPESSDVAPHATAKNRRGKTKTEVGKSVSQLFRRRSETSRALPPAHSRSRAHSAATGLRPFNRTFLPLRCFTPHAGTSSFFKMSSTTFRAVRPENFACGSSTRRWAMTGTARD